MIGMFTRRAMLAACWTLALAPSGQAFDGDNFGGSNVVVIANLDPVSGTVTFRSRGESVGGQIGRPIRVKTLGLLANLKEGDEVTYFYSRRCNCITGIDKIFRGVAVIAALDPVSGRITLDHERIAGLMDAQETSYRADKVNAPEFFANLKTGEKVEFIVERKSYSIVKGYFYRILSVSEAP
jgi:Cu/Ag efflux protein CusF